MDRKDALKTDLAMVVDEKGVADVAFACEGDVSVVSGSDNLRQALALRILVGRGELRDVGHTRYGSHVPDLVGEPLDRTNLELLRRYVRLALKTDPRVTDVTQLVVRVREGTPGVVEIDAKVKASNDLDVDLALALDLE